MNMILNMNINTEIEIKSVKDLCKLKILVEVNNLDRPNFSELARTLGVDRRTAKKYYEGNVKKERKQKKSKIDDYHDIIKSLLSAKNKQVFYYKSHLYRYLVREHGLKCSRSNFNYFILNNNKFADYFKPKSKREAIKSETPFGKQAQFDWKEKLKFSFKDGSEMLLNVGSLILSASRFKVWTIYPSTSQNHLFDFLANAFEILGGVPEEILIDNASTMMDQARTERSEGKINNKFKQLADDYGFKIVPCVRARPNTKAKVENPMRIIDEIMNYNGIMENLEELHKKMSTITNEANSRICQATNLPPILVYNKEKEHLLPLPNDKVCSFYKNVTTSAKVNTNALFKYKQNMYSVPPKLIGKTIVIEVTENNLYVYYNKNLVTIHTISENKVNYHNDHHVQLLGMTFKGQDKETVSEYANKHFKELEKFNEQLSEIM
ncbi:IS21 family transposase [Clostridium prolinivorans]|uniref:IS21 family transposase n=1 Tax=Clostridium prolinivorans TaxID=2769420 RepID=UPI000FD84A29|nr:IS21 family transposase [Clostridium prolinivorans]